jgi:CDP-diacylglycerol--serine O-phosphatidyltransferase
LRRRQEYIIVLPSLFTTGNLFCGFFAILKSIAGDFERAAYAIIIAGVFDLLDGRVARITKSQSQFGVEYDSLADVVSFGVAPAVMIYLWGLQDYGRLGWAAAFFFASCGALRLARFNAIQSDEPKSYFIGLPIPAAANTLAAASICRFALDLEFPTEILVVLAFGLGLLMVSNIRYRSFKDFDLRHRRSFPVLVILVAVVALAVTRPEIALGVAFGYYVVWGPVQEGLMCLKRRWDGPRKNVSQESTVGSVVQREKT